MTEAILTPVPSETSISEDVHHLTEDMRAFLHRHSDVVFLMGVTAVSLMINRMMMRRELRNLNFSVDIYPPEETGIYPTSFDD